MIGEHQRDGHRPQAIQSGDAGFTPRAAARATAPGGRTAATRDRRYPAGSPGTANRRGRDPGRFAARLLRVLTIRPDDAFVAADTSMSLSVESGAVKSGQSLDASRPVERTTRRGKRSRFRALLSAVHVDDDARRSRTAPRRSWLLAKQDRGADFRVLRKTRTFEDVVTVHGFTASAAGARHTGTGLDF